MANFKLLGSVDAFTVYKSATKVAIFEHGEFYVQFFKGSSPAIYRDPFGYCADVIKARREAEADKIATRRARERFAREYLAKRAERVARQPQFQF